MNHQLQSRHDEKNCSYFMPNADIIKNDKEVKIIVDLPGVDKENIEVKAKNNILTLTAKYQNEKNLKEVYSEFRYGHFQRRFSLDETLDVDKIEASNKDGVLTLIIPIIPEKAPKKITIN